MVLLTFTVDTVVILTVDSTDSEPLGITQCISIANFLMTMNLICYIKQANLNK